MKAFLVDKQCSRFIFVNTAFEGLGDQLERIFLALSLIHAHPNMNISLVVDDNFGSLSPFHYLPGYGTIFYDILNIPRQILLISTVHKLYRPDHILMVGKHDFGSYLMKTMNFESSFPCNTMFEVDVYDSCQGNWCPSLHEEEMQLILKPVLREVFAACNNCRYATHFTPLIPSLLNFVWHVRSGDVCYHCNSPNYYHDIYEFIISSFKRHHISMPSHQNIVVHQKTFSRHIPYLFHEIPHLVLFNSEHMKDIVCTFMNTDVLISTGSSLPSVLAWFTFPERLVLIEDGRKTFGNTTVINKFVGNVNDTIRIDGDLMNSKSSRFFVEQLHPALDRILKNQIALDP